MPGEIYFDRGPTSGFNWANARNVFFVATGEKRGVIAISRPWRVRSVAFRRLFATMFVDGEIRLGVDCAGTAILGGKLDPQFLHFTVQCRFMHTEFLCRYLTVEATVLQSFHDHLPFCSPDRGERGDGLVRSMVLLFRRTLPMPMKLSSGD